MTDNPTSVRTFRTAQFLGYAGLLPQLLAVVLFFRGEEWGWIALAGGFAYASVIFSFLGGVWWGQSISDPNAPRWALFAAVLPSLIGVGLFIPWTLGWPWPEPSLIWIGVLLAASPLVDHKLNLASRDWMRLRRHLSFGLGLLTLILGVAAYASRPELSAI